MHIGQYTTETDETNEEQPWCGAKMDEGTVVDLSEAGDAPGINIPRSRTELLSE